MEFSYVNCVSLGMCFAGSAFALMSVGFPNHPLSITAELATFLLAGLGTSSVLGSGLAPFPYRHSNCMLGSVGKSGLQFVFIG